MLAAAGLAGLAWAGARAAARRVGGDRRVRFAATAAPLIAVAAGALIAVSGVSDPVGRVKDQYDAFTSLDTTTQGGSRFTSGAGNRYDYWRVAWKQFRDEPVKGVGAGNYDSTYFVERRTPEDIKQPHSIQLQALSELGLVGGAALAAFLLAVLAGLVRRANSARADTRLIGVTVAAGGTFLVWLIHTSVDWLHLIPGATGVALCAAACLVGPWRRPASRGGRPRPIVVVGCAALVLFGAVLLGRAALADRLRAEARDALAADPREALRKTESSLSLNDEALPTYYIRAAAHARLGRYEPARATLLEATRREPHDYVSWALLGDLATRRADFDQAFRDYDRASDLNPRGQALATLTAPLLEPTVVFEGAQTFSLDGSAPPLRDKAGLEAP